MLEAGGHIRIHALALDRISQDALYREHLQLMYWSRSPVTLRNSSRSLSLAEPYPLVLTGFSVDPPLDLTRDDVHTSPYLPLVARIIRLHQTTADHFRVFSDINQLL